MILYGIVFVTQHERDWMVPKSAVEKKNLRGEAIQYQNILDIRELPIVLFVLWIA